MPNTMFGHGRWVYPIGPAPEGWMEREHCSRTIPHDEAANGPDSWQDDDMNLDHYDNLRFVAIVDWEVIIGVFDTLWDAAEAIKNSGHKLNVFIEAYTGHIKVNVPNHWKEGVGI